MGLIKKIADGICKLLAMQGIIQKEDLELYRYGIENGIIVVLNFLTSVVIGIITGRLGVVLVFLCFYVPLRTYGGGVHLKSKWLCYLLSNLILLIPIYTYDAGMKLLSKAGYVLLLLPAVIVIFVLCPVESVNKRLDKGERKYYRRATHCISALELCVLAVFFVLELDHFLYAGGVSFLLVALFMVIGKVTSKHYT